MRYKLFAFVSFFFSISVVIYNYMFLYSLQLVYTKPLIINNNNVHICSILLSLKKNTYQVLMTNDVGNMSKTEAISNLLEHRWTFMDGLEPQVDGCI